MEHGRKERERERDGESEREVNPFPCFNLELCFRVIKGTSTFANHQAGRAILLPPFLFKPTTRVDEYQVTYRMKWHFPQKAGKEASSHKMQGATGYKFPAQSYCSIVGGGQHPWTRRAINALHQIHILFWPSASRVVHLLMKYKGEWKKKDLSPWTFSLAPVCGQWPLLLDGKRMDGALRYDHGFNCGAVNIKYYWHSLRRDRYAEKVWRSGCKQLMHLPNALQRLFLSKRNCFLHLFYMLPVFIYSLLLSV